MQQTWGCLFVQNYQGLAKTLTWKFSFLTYDHCIIKLTLLLKGFNIFHQSFFCLYLLIFYIYVQHPPVATITFVCTYGKLIFSTPAALIILVCLWRTLKIHQFWPSERFPTVHRRKKVREFDTILDTFSHQYVQVMLQRHCFCCIPSGGSRPCSREQITDSHLLVILQSSCEYLNIRGRKYQREKVSFTISFLVSWGSVTSFTQRFLAISLTDTKRKKWTVLPWDKHSLVCVH